MYFTWKSLSSQLSFQPLNTLANCDMMLHCGYKCNFPSLLTCCPCHGSWVNLLCHSLCCCTKGPMSGELSTWQTRCSILPLPEHCWSFLSMCRTKDTQEGHQCPLSSKWHGEIGASNAAKCKSCTIKSALMEVVIFSFVAIVLVRCCFSCWFTVLRCC